MPEQSDFPEKWTCDAPSKTVKVELRVPNELDDVEAARLGADDVSYSWIEIPTSGVTQWVEKGDAARIQRTAKVEFPSEWGRNTDAVEHNSPRRLVEQYDPSGSNPFLHARVSFKDTDRDTWVQTHYGWVGGVGGSEHDLEHKLWVYDFSELLGSVPLGHTFNDPTVVQALDQIGDYTAQRTSVPLREAQLIPPNSEEELASIRGFFAPGSGRDVPEPQSSPYYGGGDELAVVGDLYTRTNIGSKTFVSNHDTLGDMYDWYESKTGSKLHFEPRSSGVALVSDIEPSRRQFVADSALEAYDDKYHESVRVRKNNALYEMKPMNTLHLRGDVDKGFTVGDIADKLERGAKTALPLFEGAAPPSEEFPVVTVQVPSLVEAADGAELSPEVVESSASTKDEAEAEATKELRELLEETSEGEIVMDGVPRLLPFDGVTAFEVCDGNVTYEQQPVTYEVESVRHEKAADSTFETRVRVSIWANDEHIETVEKRTVTTNTA